jgi:hypothetical protein
MQRMLVIFLRLVQARSASEGLEQPPMLQALLSKEPSAVHLDA